ncbi:hypothetical protein, partial [Burkholderia sp. MSMB1498]|uniref:hypothetical protein n=1 Tax=Burkholderia sp. MSMB1498 TaxID=1637842 RepID=UPI001E612133
MSAAEKRDYDHLFAARQQLFYYRVALRPDHLSVPPVGYRFDRTTSASELPASPLAPRSAWRERGVIVG